MNRIAGWCLGSVVALAWLGQTTLAGEPATLGSIERLDAAFDKLVAPAAKLEILGSGFTWSEGPIWVRDGAYLLFSDIPRNSIFKWQAASGLSLFLCPSGYTGNTFYGREPGSNGLTLDAQGQLVLCQHGDRRVAVLTKQGGLRTLVDSYQGKRLNSPNDLVYKSNGDLYFTDPPYGLPQGADDPRRELDFCGVYRLTPKGELTLLTAELTRPNGLAFSPDEKILYVAQSDPAAAIWKAFPVQGDGSLGSGRTLYDATAWVGKRPGLPDGLKVDRQGNLWATGPGGVLVLNPEGKLLGRLDTGCPTANCAFGEDGKTLFVTADSYLCRIRTLVAGAK